MSVHTLASAAQGILEGISKNKGTPFHTIISSRIKTEHLSEAFRIINKAQNFFKHADKDFDHHLDFEEGTNELKLMHCCIGYGELHGELTEMMLAFMFWLKVFYTQLFNISEEEKTAIKTQAALFSIKLDDRRQSMLAGRAILRNKGLDKVFNVDLV